MPFSQPDVVVIGGGVVGLATALTLAKRYVSVTLLDRQSLGREASWAGAGMLPPGNPGCALTPEARLRSYSHSLWPDFAAELVERTGIDIGYHVCGAIEVASPETQHEFQQHCEQWQAEGIRVESLETDQLHRHVADLNREFASGVFLPDFAQVRNPRYLQAMKAACLQRGVEIIEHVQGLECLRADDRIKEVRIHGRTLHAENYCFTAGAWTTALLQPLGFAMPVKPVRGQIVQLQLPTQAFRSVIEMGRRYLVPRRDGLILIGSTEEDVGFAKHTTTEGVSGLLEFAKSLVPSLAFAEVVNTWAGLRPGSPDELPLLGLVPEFSNAFIGAGHFRSGLQMSPATGRILADLLMGRTPEILLDGLHPDRFTENNDFQSPALRCKG